MRTRLVFGVLIGADVCEVKHTRYHRVALPAACSSTSIHIGLLTIATYDTAFLTDSMNAVEGAKISYVLCEVVCIFMTETQYSILNDRSACYSIHVSGIQVFRYVHYVGRVIPAASLSDKVSLVEKICRPTQALLANLSCRVGRRKLSHRQIGCRSFNRDQ